MSRPKIDRPRNQMNFLSYKKKSPIIGYEPKLSFFTFKPSEVYVHANR
jgi:hypothetical protein